MALVDDLSATVPTEEISRRRALGMMTTAALGVAGVGTVITTIRYMSPNVLFEPATRFEVGRPEDIPVGTLIVLAAQKLYVVHDEAGFFAMSSVCTHLGCMTRYDDARQGIFCPCHGSQYDKQGRVTGGPAPRPLVRLELTLERGRLVVDSRKEVAGDFILEV